MHSILLVDDSGFFREMSAGIENRFSCRLLTAGNGSEALAVARKERPDLIYLDAEMSGMTGVDVCRVLKADSHFGRIPMVVVSGQAFSDKDVRRSGADAWLSKPLDEIVFFDSIRRLLKLPPRAGNRTSVGWPMTFWRDGVQHDATLKDLSRGGFFIITSVRQPIGARLEISFEVPESRPERTVVAEAIIVRVSSEPEKGLGCRFFRLTATPKTHLEECLKLLEAKV